MTTLIGPGRVLSRVAVRRDHGLDMTYVTEPGAHCYRRLFEWLATLMMLMSSVLALSPIGTGAAPNTFLLFMLALAVVRVVALYLNGRLHAIGPRIRAGCALLGALVWFKLMMILQHHGGLLPLEVPIYVGLIAGEVITCYRSAADVHFAHHQ